MPRYHEADATVKHDIFFRSFLHTPFIEVDQAALTGESLPLSMYQGDSCKMGSTVVRGETCGTVEYTGQYCTKHHVPCTVYFAYCTVTYYALYLPRMYVGADTFFGKTAALLTDTGNAIKL